MKTITIAARFCGPPTSANGGYFAGMVAALGVAAGRGAPAEAATAGPAVAGRGRTPTARCRFLTVRRRASARPIPRCRHCNAPAGPSYLEAVEASRGYAGFRYHRFPGCFVCGTHRVRGDGLRVFAGPIAQLGVVAAPWVPDASLDRGDGKVQPQFMSAALDCPGYYAVALADQMMLLAEFTAHLDRLVHVGEPCTLIGWRIAASGRKHEAGTALFDGKGELCARARALWIEPREAAAV